MQLRPMVGDDAIAVLAVEVAATEFPWSLTQFVTSLQASDDGSVIEVEGQVVGFVIFKPVLDESTLVNIAVHPDYQGRGYGRLLLERGLQAQAEKGVTTCFLEVRASNDNAQGLYRSLGFTQVGERKDYYPAKQGREHALVMARDLPKAVLGDV